MVTAPDRRVMVRWMQTKGLSQRRALEVIHMSATMLRFKPDQIAIRSCAHRSWSLPSVIVAMVLG